jgi:Polyketide cyclase / dehydrase and lipid transport
MSHVVRAEAESSAPVETVWQLLSTVGTWSTWSRHKLARLERDGSPTPDGVGAIRVLGTDPSRPARCNREEVVAFDAPNHFGYSLLSGQPLDNYRSDVRLAARPEGGTRITWESRFGTHGATGWFWVLVVRWVLKRWSADLAKGAERVASVPASQSPRPT